MTNPTVPLDALFLGLLRPYRQSFAPVILDSRMNTQKKEKGNLISKTVKTCPKCQ
jgi:hypothetical protein